MRGGAIMAVFETADPAGYRVLPVVIYGATVFHWFLLRSLGGLDYGRS